MFNKFDSESCVLGINDNLSPARNWLVGFPVLHWRVTESYWKEERAASLMEWPVLVELVAH